MKIIINKHLNLTVTLIKHINYFIKILNIN